MMTTHNSNFRTILLLLEIELQCDLISLAATKLDKYAKHWKLLVKGIHVGELAPPIEIIANCTVCLSATASIYKLLFVGSRRSNEIAARCTLLMGLLGNPSLSAIQNISVRNSWEHMDERLGEELSIDKYNSCAPIHVAATSHTSDTFVLRHFDPIRMEIKYGSNENIALRQLIGEIKEVKLQVSIALNRLLNPRDGSN
jgi:hypothetical protein